MTTRHLEIDLHAEKHRDTPLQVQLGIQLPDPAQARRDVYELFRVYRMCREMLGRDFVEHRRKLTEPGYANAMDPDLIRRPDFDGSPPRAWGDPQTDDDLLSPQEQKWARFVRRVDTRVARLTWPKNDIIRMCFLDEPLLEDDRVFAKIQCAGWAYEKRTYWRVKGAAVQMIAAALCPRDEDGYVDVG